VLTEKDLVEPELVGHPELFEVVLVYLDGRLPGRLLKDVEQAELHDAHHAFSLMIIAALGPDLGTTLGDIVYSYTVSPKTGREQLWG